MAVDFMVMPLSRYISGDYVTPMMEQAWADGVPYRIIGPDGPRECPPNVTFGGEGAGAHREQIQGMLAEDLSKLPAPISSTLWDEMSEVHPRIHRVDHESFGRLLELAERRKGFLGFGSKAGIPELAATLFFPQDFEGVLDLDEPLEALAASAPRLLETLARTTIAPEAQVAASVLVDALRDCVDLGFPMVVDL